MFIREGTGLVPYYREGPYRQDQYWDGIMQEIYRLESERNVTYLGNAFEDFISLGFQGA